MMNYNPSQREREVWHACDDLLAMGKSIRDITGEAISWRLREIGYKAGSKTYIYRYRDSWMMARNLSHEREETAKLPSADPLERGIAVFREGLERELKKEYEKKYQLLEETISEKEALINSLENTLCGLQERLESMTRTAEDFSQKYQLQSQAFQTLHEENISYKVTVKQLEKHAKLREAESESCFNIQKTQFENALNVLKNTYEAQLLENKNTLSDFKEKAENTRHHFIVEIENYKIQVAKLETELKNTEAALGATQQQLPALMSINTKIADFSEKISNYIHLQSQEFKHISESLFILPVIQKFMDESQAFRNYLLQKIIAHDELFTEIIDRLSVRNESLATESGEI